MENSIFKFGELPEFKKFTPENINKEFPKVIEKINLDFKNIEDFLFNYQNQKKLDWGKVINPLNEVNEVLRWSWGVISHLNAVNNSDANTFSSIKEGSNSPLTERSANFWAARTNSRRPP